MIPTSLTVRAVRTIRAMGSVRNFAALSLATAVLGLSGCAAVKPFEREKLADPIMDPGSPLSKLSLEQKFFSTREGSAGGGTGVGGGCGCAK